MVCGSTVLAQGRFRRQIGTESCHRVGSRVYQRGVLSVQVRMHIGMISCCNNIFNRDLEH